MRVAGLGMEDSLGTIEEELEQLDLSTGEDRAGLMCSGSVGLIKCVGSRLKRAI